MADNSSKITRQPLTINCHCLAAVLVPSFVNESPQSQEVPLTVTLNRDAVGRRKPKEKGKLRRENLAEPFSLFSHNKSKALSKKPELCKVFLTLCGFARNYSEDLSGTLSNN
jgi:hypothetical protein